VFFVYRHFARIQLVNAVRIDIRSEHFMAGSGKACSGDESNVTTSDNGQAHFSVSSRSKILAAAFVIRSEMPALVNGQAEHSAIFFQQASRADPSIRAGAVAG